VHAEAHHAGIEAKGRGLVERLDDRFAASISLDPPSVRADQPGVGLPVHVLWRVDPGVSFHSWKVLSLQQFRQSGEPVRKHVRGRPAFHK
jgi:hypothetical protein